MLDALFLVFAAALFALVLDTPIGALRRVVPGLPRVAGLAAVLAVLLAGAVVLGLLAGPVVADQTRALAERLPGSLDNVRSALQRTSWARGLIDDLPPAVELVQSSAPLLGRVPVLFSNIAGGVAATVFVMLCGSFVAVRPGPYVEGLVRLVPPPGRDRAREVVRAVVHALRSWLVGRLAAMAAVGILTALALWLLAIPLPLALGAIAGLLTFVPFLGPLLAAVPALLIASGQGAIAVMQVVAVYGGVQVLEGNLITPLVQERAVSLPPAALFAAQLAAGLLLGAAGVLLATPLAVTVVVLVQMLYLEQVLGDEDVRVLAERGD
jgi:predicted PurR-regulated permease PerM